MARKIRIRAGKVEQTAELYDTKTADLIWDALPFTIRGSAWGDEIYFAVPVDAKPENPKAVVDMGDLGYWPPGNAFCIFFGPTPASHGDEIRPASPVNVFGKLDGDPTEFGSVSYGAEVTVEKAE